VNLFDWKDGSLGIYIVLGVGAVASTPSTPLIPIEPILLAFYAFLAGRRALFIISISRPAINPLINTFGV
jgi:hypothetical protein